MVLTEKQIAEFVGTIFSTVLHLPIGPTPGGVAPSKQGPFYRASVDISGTWKASIALESTARLCQQAAAAFYEADAAEVREDQVREAMAELANILGGNIKSLVPGQNLISLPRVSSAESLEEAGPPPRSVRRYQLDCAGEFVGVTITEN